MIIYFLVIISEYNSVLFNFEFTKSIGIMEEDIINRIAARKCDAGVVRIKYNGR